MCLPFVIALLVAAVTVHLPTALPTNTTTCPHSTWVFREGSHCCRMPVDAHGSKIVYTSASCYGDNFLVCPNGAVKGQCRDEYVRYAGTTRPHAVSAAVVLAVVGQILRAT
eukprot:TRINITY_DN11694_c0_g1_i1.p1 TRINITY_DN11694_c0_g1~~TRINITY_DN11694_c0_g1_i1.p1  ORF type:complete len:111 (-),score=12.85 TRINITY_DN11694_c0_g1_i1:38-370(-)